MQIQFLGLSGFKITTREATVIIDPPGQETGLAPTRGHADIVLLSENHHPAYSRYESLSSDPFVIQHPGEYDLKGVSVVGMPVKTDAGFQNVYMLESENIKLLFLGHLAELGLGQDELEGLGEIDVLLLPVGGHGVMNPGVAAKTANLIEAKIIIPHHYQQDGLKMTLEPSNAFLKEMGGKVEALDKLMVKKKDLTEHADTRIVCLAS